MQVVTSFGPDGYLQYGQRCLASFAAHWPATARLAVYLEAPVYLHKGEARSLFECQGCADFLARHAGDPAARGCAPSACWRAKEHAAGYSYRTDALKFCRKPFAVRDAARRLGAGLLVWLDADTVTLAPVPEGFVGGLLDEAAVAYLGRAGGHSECGFLAFRLPAAMGLIEAWAARYETDAVFALPESHDSYVFDSVRGEMPSLAARDLTPGGKGHVWCRSPLAPYLDHLKGARKALGYSPERVGR